MRPRVIILVVVNLLLVGITFFFVRNWMSSVDSDTTQAAPAASQDIEVLVAAENLGTGIMLQARHWRWQKWPEDNMSGSYISYNPKEDDKDDDQVKEDELLGSVVRRAIAEGQPIVPGAIVKPGDRGFLAAILEPGKRAMSINVTASTSGAGLIIPGDHVDVILTHRFSVATADGKKRNHRASETILRNIRTLAIDQKINSNQTEPQLGRTVTLEVTPKQAEVLALASDLGTVSLSLRGIQVTASDSIDRHTTTWDYQASRPIAPPGSVAGSGRVPTIIRGNTREKVKPKSDNAPANGASGEQQ